jgi:murein DD-endopeptidase MepM/ murein hydrolase activator NlpD
MRTRLLLAALILAASARCGGRAASPLVTEPGKAQRIDGGGAPRPAAESSREGSYEEQEIAEENVAPDTQAGDDEPSPAGRAPTAERGKAHPAGLHHILQPGQTLYSVSRQYGVLVKELMQANGITDPRTVPAGRSLLIPGSQAAPPAPDSGKPPHDGPHRKPAPHEIHLAWPLHGPITGSFGPRGQHRHHEGIDIDGERGDEIFAAASGTVIRAGIDGSYGRMVEIDHGDGLVTLYAHASRLLVQAGDQVRTGTCIAEVGGSGNARGTHLHFEVHRNDRAVDPLPFLRGPAILTAGTR